MDEKVLIEGIFKKYTKAFLIVSIITSVFGLLYVALSILSEMYYFLIATVVFELLALAFFIIYKYIAPNQQSFELTITESRVIGKLKNNRVDLPINQISSIGTLAFNGISISTSSGKIEFPYLINREEVYNCLSELIRKQNQANNVVTTQASSTVSEQLIELKNLLDSGIITEEEFDTKKKQLLGL